MCVNRALRLTLQEILHSSHHVVMITGDNPLTACHVAKELKIVKKETLIYYPPEGETDDRYHWAVCYRFQDQCVQYSRFNEFEWI